MVLIDYAPETSSFETYPYRQCAGEPRIEILQKEEYNEKIKELNAIILDPERLNMAIDKYYSECENVYSDILEPIRNRYYLGAKRRGWLPSLIGKRRKLAAANYINCEAHRDKMLFWLLNNRKHATN
jgi:poly-gamma-glutamate synthesis protein (capsule biosynthesis protein)